MSNLIDTLLLLALPASGKSEVRRYLRSLPDEQATADFGLGPNVQLDDFPYVHLMRRVSQTLREAGRPGVYFEADSEPMSEPRDWGTLIELLNEDYCWLHDKPALAPASAGRWLIERLDAARARVGAEPALGGLPEDLQQRIADVLEEEARELFEERVNGVPDSLEGKTIVIEFARGGGQGSQLPLPTPFGYAYSLAQLSDEILSRARILYVWATPEESRRRNRDRTDPNDPGSILHHGVPEKVMLEDYGTDDMEWLIEQSDRPGTLRIETRGQIFHLPVGRFDNREDKTSFLRIDRDQWPAEKVAAVHAGLKAGFEPIKP